MSGGRCPGGRPGSAARMASGVPRNSDGHAQRVAGGEAEEGAAGAAARWRAVRRHRRTNVTGFHPARRPAIFPASPPRPSPDEDRAVSNDSLSVIDNRTGKQLRAPDRRRHHQGDRPPADQDRRRRFRPDDLRPGLHEHRRLPERHHLHRRRPGHPPLPRLSDRGAGREGQLPRGGLPAGRGRAADRGRSWTKWNDDIRYHTYVHTNIIKFLEGFRYDAHPMGMLLGVVGALSTFYPDAKDIDDPANRYVQRVRLMAKMPTIAAFVLPALARPALRVPAQRPRLHRELRQHDVQHRRPARAEPGAAARARDPADPARRPRAELFHQRGARAWAPPHVDPFSAVSAGIAALYGPLHGGANEAVLRHARRDRRQEEHPRVHREGEEGRGPPDGLRPPGLQVATTRGPS